uniref:Uncharacterized protein n=1 Tax=Timema poppense TaxID=170557 RepID=A0A7R9H8R5_TIMPO|nr:unnamed protein product [Timema poppensis]
MRLEASTFVTKICRIQGCRVVWSCEGGGINTGGKCLSGIRSFSLRSQTICSKNTNTPKMKAVFAVLALFAIIAAAFAQQGAPKETLKGAEAVYLASPYAYGGYGGYGAYGAYPYASAYGAYPTAYSGYYYR